MVVFAHLADCHIGAWRSPKMRRLGLKALEQAVSHIISERMDFVVIAGDLFHTALPGIDQVKHVVRQLTRLKQADIPLYIIAGSHDYSPTGKTMLDVLEEAELCKNLFCGAVEDGKLILAVTQDSKTGVKLTGVLGRAGQLDKQTYEKLGTQHLQDVGSKSVFVFHAGVEELKPEELAQMETQSISLLPEGFGYYAGGHVHIVREASLSGYARITYPGPLFPVTFSELEKLQHGGFYVVRYDGSSWNASHTRLPVKETLAIHIVSEDKTPEELTSQIKEQLVHVEDKIILVRITGTLVKGTAADISFPELFAYCEMQGAYFCMKNTIGLRSEQLEEVVVEHGTTEEIEEQVISEHTGKIASELTKEQEELLVRKLLRLLGQPQGEETKKDYEQRIVLEAMQELKL